MKLPPALLALSLAFSPALFAQNGWRESLFSFEKKCSPERLFELPDGRLAIEPQYSFAQAFDRGLAYVGLGRESAYIKPDGSIVWRSGPR